MLGTVLLADDDRGIRTVLIQALQRIGCRVRATGSSSALWRMVEEGEGDLVITDVHMPDGDALDLLPAIRRRRPDLPVIVMSAQNNVLTAIRAAEVGAYEYLPKPFDLKELLGHVQSSLERRAKRAAEPSGAPEAAEAGRTADENLPLIGRSPAMQEVYRVMARLTQTDLTVMIWGESGTGKELVARALHDFGRRARGPFVAINMAAIPRELIESELFGHERGAFTGATARAAGRFEQAQGGTLFLDEIGDMPPEAQTRLLRVLQEGEFTSVGGRASRRTDVRIIAATHQNLKALIAEGRFREDLYYRLNVVPIRLPPLRERIGDLPDLARHFLRRAAAEGLPKKSLTPEALEAMKGHSWPGNVRELENLMRRVAVLCPEDRIPADAVEGELASVGEEDRIEAGEGGPAGRSLGAAVELHLERYFRHHGGVLPPPGLYDRVLREVEMPLIALTLSATRGNQLRASELLGINRNTLRKKIRELDIPVTRGRKMV
jgi:two-component system, NtrC family, nitrogen regulation response regulator GlnG